MSKQFVVHVSYLVTGMITVDANTEEEAEAMVEDNVFDYEDVQNPDFSELQVEYSEPV